jgi:hypothetical protein
MQLGQSTLIAVLLFLLHISPSYSQNTKLLDNWLEFCPSEQLCFERPKNLIPNQQPIIDSIAGQLDSESFTLFYDLGFYTATFKELSSATSEPITIDGHLGKILIQQNKMALTIPTVSGKIGFSMLIEFSHTEQLEQGKRIFKSVRFNL